MAFQSLREIELQGKTVLLRADLNVPKQDGKITDTTRIDRLKPTIDYLREHGAKIVVLSHFGRPDGEYNAQMSLAFLTEPLQEKWGATVKFAQDCVGEKAQSAVESLSAGEVLLLENVRFHKGEKQNEMDFVKEIAKLGDVFVNDAFSVSHRAHASTAGLAEILPCATGLLMEAEINALQAALETPQRPVAAITGGSKISTKIGVLTNLVKRVDYLILGGGMANTFLHAHGYDLANSLCEKDMQDEVKKIEAAAQESGCQIILPQDLVCVTELKPGAAFQTAPASQIPDGHMAIDTGPQSIAQCIEIIKTCKTVVWNGPLGVFEIKPFDNGTNELAQAVATLTDSGALISVAGGGDTVAALENAGAVDHFTYVSTAGGAFLEWMEGKTLPGVKALNSSPTKLAG